jgi:hypothetical protein
VVCGKSAKDQTEVVEVAVVVVVVVEECSRGKMTELGGESICR